MKRVLFVDDRPSILRTVRARLVQQPRRWDAVFVNGAEAALAECALQPFDVVVSDLSMPEMDGVALLQQIKNEHPGTIRIVLSGNDERDAVLRTLSVAHQYLSKACDVDTVSVVVEQACSLGEVMGSDTLRAIVGRIEKLPSLPTLYVELTRALSGPSPSMTDVVRIVERDPAMSMKLLQVVNSSFFRRARRLTSIRGAIVYLGIDVLKSLVLAAQIFSGAGVRAREARVLATVQRRGILTAQMAQKVAQSRPDDAFTAGLLHDVGLIVLAQADADRFYDRQIEAARRGVPIAVVENERLGVSHADVGAYLLGTWGVPVGVVHGVLGHHDPARYEVSFETATVVHVASTLIEQMASEGQPSAAAPALDEAHLHALGLQGEIAAWRSLAARLWAERQP
jgi:HD-like signal output (HDOD) protein